MGSAEALSFSFFEWYDYFLAYSFLGWMMESAFVSVKNGRWVNRGFLRGPFCPIYGTGALLMIVGLTPLLGNLPLLFLGGVLIATAVEYAVGAALEKLFHATWWDYSEMPFQFRGRVCLQRSLEWGALSVVLMRYLQPLVAAFLAAVPGDWGKLAEMLLTAWLAADGEITVLHILQFNEKLEELSRVHTRLRERLESTKLYGSRKDIMAHFESVTMAEALQDMKERLERTDEELQEMRLENRLRLEYHWKEIQEKMELRMQLLEKSSATERRMLQTYPRLKSKRFDEELRALKKEMDTMKKRKNGKDV